MFAISLFSLFSYHVYLISQNRTTLEAFRPPIFRHGGSDRRGFYLGKLNNLREVLGDQTILWFVPVFSSLGDGLTFPRQCQMDEETGGYSDGYDSADQTNNTRPRQNRRFQTNSINDIEDDTITSDADDEQELLLPRNSTKTWTEQDTAQAETSPDSPEVRYEGFNRDLTITNNNHTAQHQS